MVRHYGELVARKWDEGKFLCVGLDPDIDKIPKHILGSDVKNSIVEFNCAIVDATKDIVAAYKPNSAFYEAHGSDGWEALKHSIDYVHENAPDVPVILDAKRGDIGNTNHGYVQAAFDYLRADAITLHPYLGRAAIQPFLDRSEKGIIVLCRTSNPGAVEFQDLQVANVPLYVHVAKRVADEWNANGNCSLVIGATYPDEMKLVRAVAPKLPFLIPGIGTQGGDLQASVAAGKDKRNRGILISASRSVLFASGGTDFAVASRAKTLEMDSLIKKAM